MPNKNSLCNLCGNSTVPLEGPFAIELDSYGLVDAVVAGGYFSIHLCDGIRYKFSICEKCLRKLFEQFVIKPDVSNYMDNSAWSYEKELYTYKYRLWIDSGAQIEKFNTGLCNFCEDCEEKGIWWGFIEDEFINLVLCEQHVTNYYNVNVAFYKEMEAKSLIKKSVMKNAIGKE